MNPSRIIFILLLFAGMRSFAQPASIKASVDKNRILIGEPFHFKIEAFYPVDPGTHISVDSLLHFEVSGQPKVDSTVGNGMVNLVKTYTLTSFDSGHWVIPSIMLSKKIRTDTLPVDVVFSDFDPKQDYHPIKDIIEVKVAKSQPWWMYAVAGGLILGALLYYILKKRKKPVIPVKKEILIRDPYEAAMQELEALNITKPDPRTYYTRLTEILRLYLFRRKGLLSLQKTTDDLVIQMKGLSLSKEELEKISQTLRLSDFVKFARYQPGPDDDRQSFDIIKQTIIRIERSSADKIT